MSDLLMQAADMKTRHHVRDGQEISEIDGYLELGMEEEALTVIRATFEKEDISNEEFHTCVFALLQSQQPEPWKRTVESAYRQLQASGSRGHRAAATIRGSADDRVRSAMLNYYFSINEPEKAFAFFPRRSTRFFDAWTMMQVCLELDKLGEAKKLARYVRGVLASADDDFTKASMADALAAYYTRIGDYDSAIDVWENAPHEQPFERQRLAGIVKARLLQALQAAKSGLATIAEAKLKDDLSIQIELPGNTAALYEQTERELKNLEGGIAAVLGSSSKLQPSSSELGVAGE